MELLQTLCGIRAVSGDEGPMKSFLRDYIETHQHSWAVQPQIVDGPEFQDTLILLFGTPRTAIFAHIDSIGFTSGYGKQLIRVGSPRTWSGMRLWGEDSQGLIDCRLVVNEEEQELLHDFHRELDRGTNLSFYPDFRENDQMVQCCYMDNRLGVYNALKVAESLRNGAIVFSTYEEHGGGSVGFLAEYLWKNHGVRQALISDITWVTDGVHAGKGVAISLRDSGIPRKAFLNRIVQLARDSGIAFQLEVESAGGSDGTELQKGPYPFDWCFIGAPETGVHSPDECVAKHDISAMIALYAYLMERL